MGHTVEFTHIMKIKIVQHKQQHHQFVKLIHRMSNVNVNTSRFLAITQLMAIAIVCSFSKYWIGFCL